jgi:cyclopropane fatty-acyl-phospholipid synthase-like methyltransferase
MYGDWDWEAAVELVGESLNPRTSRSIFDTVGSLGVGPSDVVLDIGGRDGSHALLMAERFGCRVVVVDPAEANLADGERNIVDHQYGHLVEIRRGTIEEIPAADGRFSLVFSRDMMNHVVDIDRGLAECHRVLRPGGAMVIHQVFATDLLEPREAERLWSDVATVPERMTVADFERAAARTGFNIDSLDVIGSEWYEANQEAGVSPNYALQVSRLNRVRDRYLEELGETAYRIVYGNALWAIYLLIGKLETRLYVLRRGD